ncbi:uncharacterized protein EV420DRAFT_314550 [Desarmillaria tabescens]|uniref:Uncharacterized protein n=1 Tax=Armillaria tabescens TaxID=1929756 RepID=A0AA39KEH6_ARMTA|nr:uncharacterized protein EV420DRAFT_314550 [Desarmillaria tabescens]KAK0459308.1 hypothetical protein EV420DRAFT_314550 [Desarmillaria tabescens]
MRWTLLVHHLCTLFAIIFIQIALQMALDPAIASAGLIWLFQATTEQSIFIGLVLYRLRYAKETVQSVLRFAAIQSFIFKFGFAIYLLVWWAVKLAKFHHPIDIALNVVVVLILSSLMATQVLAPGLKCYEALLIPNLKGKDRTQCGASQTTWAEGSPSWDMLSTRIMAPNVVQQVHLESQVARF